MPTSTCDYVYLPLRDAKKVLNVRINLMAKVFKIGTVLRSRGTDYVLVLRLVDQYESPPGLIMNFFAENLDKLPQVRSTGDIISLHHVEMKVNNREFFCTFNGKLSSFALFNGEAVMDYSPYQTSINYEASVNDKKLLMHLRTTSKNRQPEQETDLADSSYSTLMESLTYPEIIHKFRTIVRVVMSYPWEAKDLRTPETGYYRVRLTIEDSTARIHAYIFGEDGEKFFNGYPPIDRLTEKMNSLLGIRECPVIRNPPWVWCCLKSYYLDENDPWGSRRYRIFGTTLLG